MDRNSCEAYVTLDGWKHLSKSHCFGYFLGIASASHRRQGEPKPEHHSSLGVRAEARVSNLNLNSEQIPQAVKASGRVILP
jgi:hypothetical protein